MDLEEAWEQIEEGVVVLILKEVGKEETND
jgi:hypothetical protein